MSHNLKVLRSRQLPPPGKSLWDGWTVPLELLGQACVSQRGAACFCPQNQCYSLDSPTPNSQSSHSKHSQHSQGWGTPNAMARVQRLSPPL